METLFETDRWTLKKDGTAALTVATITFRLYRNEKFRTGLFKKFTGSIDFKYESDAELMLTLVENLELLTEQNLLESIEASADLRETYFKSAAFARTDYNKTSPAARKVKGGFGVHNQQIGL